MLQIVIAQSFGLHENDRTNFYFISTNVHGSNPDIRDKYGTIENDNRCFHIRKLLHINTSQEAICQNLQCYYDDLELCLCKSFHGFSNCFSIDKNEMFNCDENEEMCEI